MSDTGLSRDKRQAHIDVARNHDGAAGVMLSRDQRQAHAAKIEAELSRHIWRHDKTDELCREALASLDALLAYADTRDQAEREEAWSSPGADRDSDEAARERTTTRGALTCLF